MQKIGNKITNSAASIYRPRNNDNSSGFRDEKLLGWSDKPLGEARKVGAERAARVLTPVRNYKRTTYTRSI